MKARLWGKFYSQGMEEILAEEEEEQGGARPASSSGEDEEGQLQRREEGFNKTELWQLFTAVHEGDVDTLGVLLAKVRAGWWLDVRDEANQTPCYLAARGRHFECLLLLIEANCDPSLRRDDEGCLRELALLAVHDTTALSRVTAPTGSPLWGAQLSGDVRCVRVLESALESAVAARQRGQGRPGQPVRPG